jgi:hypothetical protein
MYDWFSQAKIAIQDRQDVFEISFEDVLKYGSSVESGFCLQFTKPRHYGF